MSKLTYNKLSKHYSRIILESQNQLKTVIDVDTDLDLKNSQDSIEEDMVAPVDGGSAQPGQSFQTPGSLAGGMDTLSLAGPMGGSIGSSKKKKPKSKKSKTSIIGSRVLSFKDFIDGSGYD